MLFLVLFYRYGILIEFLMLNQPCISGVRCQLAIVHTFSLCGWIWFASFLLKIFMSIFVRAIGLHEVLSCDVYF